MRACGYCGREFKPRRATTRFCSKSCKSRAQVRTRLPGTVYERHGERIKAERRERYATDPEYRRKVLARVAAAKHRPERQPCERCGDPNADRHHDDYDKPLEVRWLCRSCHIKHHAELAGSWGSGLTVRPA